MRKGTTTKPVSSISGKEFHKLGKSIIDTAGNWFSKEYGGVVESPCIGKIIINRRGVRNSISHGLRGIKALCFCFCP